MELIRKSKPTLAYWFQTEVHVYGFAVGASVLLSFFPFLIVMVSLCRYVLHWPGAENAIYFALDDAFPGEMGAFITRNLKATVLLRGPFQWVSVFLLFLTANGIFEPLEVALNRVFGCKTNRSFLRNQLVSLGLVFLCGTLSLASSTLAALNQAYIARTFGTGSELAAALGTVFFKLAAVPMVIVMLLLVYWLLPNCKVPFAKILPAAVIVGLLLEGLKYARTLLWPWLSVKIRHEYGPFINSVVIILMSFFATMLVLAGAEWAAREEEEPVETADRITG